MRALIAALFAVCLAKGPGLAAPPAGAPAAADPVVRRGDRVSLSARIGGVIAQVDAEALQDGRPGETIRVRNLQSGRVQQGRVARAGEVEVTH